MTSEFTVAVHSLVYLFHHSGEVYSSEALAKNVCTNPARIRKVLAKLKKAGLVETKEGMEGGYRAEVDCGAVTLDQIAQVLEVAFVSTSWRSGGSDQDCMIASGMGDAMEELCSELDSLCRKRLSQITIADIDRKLTQQ